MVAGKDCENPNLHQGEKPQVFELMLEGRQEAKAVHRTRRHTWGCVGSHNLSGPMRKVQTYSGKAARCHQRVQGACRESGRDGWLVPTFLVVWHLVLQHFHSLPLLETLFLTFTSPSWSFVSGRPFPSSVRHIENLSTAFPHRTLTGLILPISKMCSNSPTRCDLELIHYPP